MTAFFSADDGFVKCHIIVHTGFVDGSRAQNAVGDVVHHRRQSEFVGCRLGLLQPPGSRFVNIHHFIRELECDFALLHAHPNLIFHLLAVCDIQQHAEHASRPVRVVRALHQQPHQFSGAVDRAEFQLEIPVLSPDMALYRVHNGLVVVLRQNKLRVCKSLRLRVLRGITINLVVRLICIQNGKLFIQRHMANAAWRPVKHHFVIFQFLHNKPSLLPRPTAGQDFVRYLFFSLLRYHIIAV